MELLGDPQERLHCIHVAGTNGKGSVCAFLEAMLRSAGFCVGKYISPNLVRVNERITINGKEISDGELSALLAHLETESAEVRRRTGEIPSQFEIWTAAAFCYFAEKSCDYVILETGLGGEFDATNVISGNVMAVLTHIDFDHTQLLGDTLAKVRSSRRNARPAPQSAHIRRRTQCAYLRCVLRNAASGSLFLGRRLSLASMIFMKFFPMTTCRR